LEIFAWPRAAGAAVTRQENDAKLSLRTGTVGSTIVTKLVEVAT
jgi:hypothetical protein